MQDIYLKSKNPTVLILEDQYIHTEGLRKIIESEVLITRGDNVNTDFYKEILEVYSKHFIKYPNEFELYNVYALTGFPVLFRPLGNYYIMEELAYDEMGRPVFVNGLETSKNIWSCILNKEDLLNICKEDLSKKVLVEKDLLLNWELIQSVRIFKGIGSDNLLGSVIVGSNKSSNFELIEVTFSKLLYFIPNLIDLAFISKGAEWIGSAYEFKKEKAFENSKYKNLPVNLLLPRKENFNG